MSNILNKPKQDYSIETKITSFTEGLEWITLGRDSDRRLFKISKRLFDIIVASGTLLVVLPLILIGALAVKLTSPGPAFYRAKRAGLGGQSFEMYKLRTMHNGKDSHDRKITAVQDDRITSVGKFLRKTKIDELPQLWNILRGEMSVVGPRPEEWDIVERYYTPEQRQILETRPGIACPVDVRWYPDLTYHDPPPPGISIQEWYLGRHLPAQVAEGVHYVEQQSLLLDLEVIGRMIICVAVYSWLLPKKQPLPSNQAGLSEVTYRSTPPEKES
jgi:lipopolysaccharide/colanic/teichoic acid biosynthesis glycosyltransferase